MFKFHQFSVHVTCGRGTVLLCRQQIRYVLPVLWVTSCLHTYRANGQNQRRRVCFKFGRWRHRGRSLPSASGISGLMDIKVETLDMQQADRTMQRLTTEQTHAPHRPTGSLPTVNQNNYYQQTPTVGDHPTSQYTAAINNRDTLVVYRS